MPRTSLAMVVVVGSAVTGAHAGFVGWTGSVRSSGGYVLLDVFAAVDGAQDHLLNVFGMQVAATHHPAALLLDLGVLWERERPWPLVAPSAPFDTDGPPPPQPRMPPPLLRV